uniref:ORF42a n=1 Tax=Pinus koraiensis TaxID=88728 RepID=A4QMK0_PINKO|nr:ORF42a [Pinus koraiensis]ABP35372.1 ORF42a [Pinus koraiensis]
MTFLSLIIISSYAHLYMYFNMENSHHYGQRSVRFLNFIHELV